MSKSKIFSLITMNLTMSTIMMMNESPLFMWIMMEISNSMFIMTFTMMQTNNMNIPALMMLIQFFSSSLILMGIVDNGNTLMSLGILMKLGMFPSHNWMPMVIYNSPWNLNLLTMTLPKIQPFLLMDTLESRTVILISTMLTSIITVIKLLKTANMKVIMALSSMIQSSWMTFAQVISFKSWVLYFTMYSMNTLIVCKILSMNMNINPNTVSKITKLFMLMLMFSMMSVPPTIMFIGKLYLTIMNSPMLILTLLILMISSMMSIMYYSRMYLKMILLHSSYSKAIKLMKNPFIKTGWLIFLILLMLII